MNTKVLISILSLLVGVIASLANESIKTNRILPTLVSENPISCERSGICSNDPWPICNGNGIDLKTISSSCWDRTLGFYELD